jgi:hypothetical protein
MLIHGLHPFPLGMEEMLREVLSLDPIFPDGKRLFVDQVKWLHRFDDWKRGVNLDEGREALRQVLAELRHNADAPPSQVGFSTG